MVTRKHYPSDMSDAQWEMLKPLLGGPASGRGRRPVAPRREVVNAIFYVLRTGCQWRYLPEGFPNWNTVYWYFARWLADGTWEQVNDELRRRVRVQAGREAEPSAAIMDSQSVKTTEKGGSMVTTRGKKINGRKRHLLVDTLGLLIAVVVHPADVQDRDGAKLLLDRLAQTWKRLRLIWADGGYAGQLIAWVRALRKRNPVRLEIVKRSDDIKGFKVLPRRWGVERTFGWLGRQRRLSKDYESSSGDGS
jgi:putative transposase